MNTRLLYYPYINVPNTAWAYRSLLYYDTISAIVPTQYIGSRDRYEPFMQDLVDRHLVLPIDPRGLDEFSSRVGQQILNYVGLPQFDIERRRASFHQSRLDRVSMPTLINREKFLDSVFHELNRLELAFHDRGHFFDVEPEIGRLMMLWLTNGVAKRYRLDPVTDDLRHLRVHFTRNVDPNIRLRRDRLLEGILPGPEFIELDKLMDFKFNYEKELYRFRLMIEEFALDEGFDDDRRMANKIAQINDLKEELTARMSEDGFSKIVGTTLQVTTDGAIAAISKDPGSVVGAFRSLKERLTKHQDNQEGFYEPTGIKYLALVYKQL
jgi:hypothetical protein